MKRKILHIFLIVTVIIFATAISASALTEAEVQSQVSSVGREAVVGNIFIWFLCAVSFLKISQKIDSFMSSLGINVGHTGGSMLSEALVAARGISEGSRFFGGGSFSFGGGSRGTSGVNGTNGAAGMFSGGLAGIVGRQFNRDAMKAASGQDGGAGGIGGRLFRSSLEKGGGFANNIVGAIAKGDISSVGTMTGDSAAKALASYMGYMGYMGYTGNAETAGDAGQSFDPLGVGEACVDNAVYLENSESLMPSNTAIPVDSAAMPDVTGTSSYVGNSGADGQIPTNGHSEPIGHIGETTVPQGDTVQNSGNPAFTMREPIGHGDIPAENDSALPQHDPIAYNAEAGSLYQESIPAFSNVEIGGGRITGVETSAEHPNSVQFGMYSADKYSSLNYYRLLNL
jgi:hypothetical protein